MIVLKAKRDMGSLGLVYTHYTINTPDSDICGGIYIKKGIEVPSRLVIDIKNIEENNHNSGHKKEEETEDETKEEGEDSGMENLEREGEDNS